MFKLIKLLFFRLFCYRIIDSSEIKIFKKTAVRRRWIQKARSRSVEMMPAARLIASYHLSIISCGSLLRARPAVM